MSAPFVGEIRVFAFDFAPKGWALCAGQLMAIAQNPALFAILQTFYGGNGVSTFALPNLQGQAPMHTGQGKGLSDRVLGEMGGEQTVTLALDELPAHDHSVQADQHLAQSADPSGGIYQRANYDDGNGHAIGVDIYNTIVESPDTPLDPQSVLSAGNGGPHNNMMPSLVLNFCIALQGIYPTKG
jgi:microcystin-dependent protein